MSNVILISNCYKLFRLGSIIFTLLSEVFNHWGIEIHPTLFLYLYTNASLTKLTLN